MVGKTISISGFSITTTADVVKKFLEKHTGTGTVYAIKVRASKVTKPRPFAYAVVQFTERQHAEEIKSMIERSVHHLRVHHKDRDIVPKPKVSMFDLRQTSLHLGCQVSDEKLAVLCTISDVAVNFGAKMRKICFSLSWKDRSYKLELSYESIWEIQLHRSSSLRREFLLFLVQESPRIYEKRVCTSELIYEDPNLNFFMDLQDDQWIRTTDFTSLSYIGQSSAFCVELPHGCNLPSIGDYFVYYREVNDRFSLLSGLPYSHGLNLVPIVQPTEVDIPYKILFKVNHMIQNGTLSGPTVDERCFRLIDPSQFPVSYIERALEELSYSKTCCFDPAKWLSDRYSKYRKSNHHTESTSITLDSGLVYVHRVQVTPSKVYFYGPDIIVSNRVLRHYSEYLEDFIRISYVDEDGEKMRPTDLLPRSASEKHTDIYKRILSTLGEGIVLGNKKFEFLAFSSSQLRENSVWMFASRNGLSAADIRKWMGDFTKIRNVAKYAARLGQSFSSSTETLRVLRHEVALIPDIENSEGYLFSDGIGKISPDFARRVANKCQLKSSTPSAFQIRYGGYKGVVAVDPTSTLKLSLRKSMSKYESENTTLDVLAYSKYQPCFLNRQLITLLSTLGVADDVFEAKQEEVVDKLDEILTDPKRAEEALEFMSPGETTNVLREILLCGYRPDEEPFLSMSLQTFRVAKLFELRTKSRIFVPKGRSMMGCLDETRTLDYGQVFVQVSCAGSRQFSENGLSRYGQGDSSERTVVVEGPVVVAKNPCLHPGDVRVLIAVDVPDLHHMVDCVVFPQRGKRPHPNECSGSDLDGDIYFVSWDPELIPLRLVPPMEYTAAPSAMLDHDVSIEEVQEYFTNYIVNNSLGMIANAHTVFADREPMKTESPECLELAKLFSIAVDFPKTGVPAVIPPHLLVKEYPDFMEKLDKPTYISQGVIGKLFRTVKRLGAKVNHIEAFTREVAIKTYDPDMEMPGFERYLEDAYWFKGEYDFKLGNLMDHYGIKTEAEVLTGNMTKLYKVFNKYKDGEVLTRAVKSLRKEVRTWFEGTTGTSNEENDLDAKASACYYVTYHWEYWGCYNEELKRPHFLSFPWCLYDRLISIKRMKINHRQSTVELLRRRMESRLRFG